jgi:hypothetical protein
MPGRGLATAALLIFIALACLSALRTLERDRRLLQKLRDSDARHPGSGIALATLSADERDCATALAAAGVLIVRAGQCYIEPTQLAIYRRKRIRLAFSGALGALALAVLVALLILRR